MPKPIERILLLVAMQSEADPLIRALQLQPSPQIADPQLPFKTYEAARGDQHLALLVSGTDPRHNVDNIGTQAATLMAYVGIEHFHPDLAISAGTAGGFAARGAQIGTVYLSDAEFLFHDRHVPLAGFDRQGSGNYPAANVRALAQQLGLPFGKISSGSSFRKDDEQLRHIVQSGAVAKEMEAAAIAWVCWLKQVPLVGVKSITNLLDEAQTSEQQFVDHFAAATQQLTAQVEHLIDAVRGRTLAELAG